MTWVPSCHICPTALPGDAVPNFVTYEGHLRTLCGDCWEAVDGMMCEVCDRLADYCYDDDVVDFDFPMLSVWPFDEGVQVCTACLWPLVAAEWVTRHELTPDAAEIAAALAGGEWAGDIAELADVARVLAGGAAA